MRILLLCIVLFSLSGCVTIQKEYVGGPWYRHYIEDSHSFYRCHGYDGDRYNHRFTKENWSVE